MLSLPYARADLVFQELLVMASLAAILLHGSLSAILSDHGLPLGLATSAFSFARVSYFWSPAFWGGTIGVCQQRRLKGLLIVFLVCLSGLLAAVTGPASAILMLPRTNVLDLNKTQPCIHKWLTIDRNGRISQRTSGSTAPLTTSGHPH